jgi:hypothetical protein
VLPLAVGCQYECAFARADEYSYAAHFNSFSAVTSSHAERLIDVGPPAGSPDRAPSNLRRLARPQMDIPASLKSSA